MSIWWLSQLRWWSFRIRRAALDNSWRIIITAIISSWRRSSWINSIICPAISIDLDWSRISLEKRNLINIELIWPAFTKQKNKTPTKTTVKLNMLLMTKLLQKPLDQSFRIQINKNQKHHCNYLDISKQTSATWSKTEIAQEIKWPDHKTITCQGLCKGTEDSSWKYLLVIINKLIMNCNLLELLNWKIQFNLSQWMRPRGWKKLSWFKFPIVKLG
jgi:hypothetical protein